MTRSGIEGSDRGSREGLLYFANRARRRRQGGAAGCNRRHRIAWHPPPDDVLAIDVDGCTPLHPPAASYEHEFAKSLAFRANERVSVEGDKYSCCCCCCRTAAAASTAAAIFS